MAQGYYGRPGPNPGSTFAGGSYSPRRRMTAPTMPAPTSTSTSPTAPSSGPQGLASLPGRRVGWHGQPLPPGLMKKATAGTGLPGPWQGVYDAWKAAHPTATTPAATTPTAPAPAPSGGAGASPNPMMYAGGNPYFNEGLLYGIGYNGGMMSPGMGRRTVAQPYPYSYDLYPRDSLYRPVPYSPEMVEQINAPMLDNPNRFPWDPYNRSN